MITAKELSDKYLDRLLTCETSRRQAWVDTINEESPDYPILVEALDYVHNAPKSVRCSDFGCKNCLWASVECVLGSKYEQSDDFRIGKKQHKTCKNYVYFD
jgi:hypothetical protein